MAAGSVAPDRARQGDPPTVITYGSDYLFSDGETPTDRRDQAVEDIKGSPLNESFGYDPAQVVAVDIGGVPGFIDDRPVEFREGQLYFAESLVRVRIVPLSSNSAGFYEGGSEAALSAARDDMLEALAAAYD